MNSSFKSSLILCLLMFLLHSCGNKSFYKQKFTNLKEIKTVDEEQEVEAIKNDDNTLVYVSQTETEEETKVGETLEVETELAEVSSNGIDAKEPDILKDVPNETAVLQDAELSVEEPKEVQLGSRDSNVDGGRVTIIVLFWLAVALVIAAFIYAISIALEGATLAALWPATIMSGIALLIFLTLYILSLFGVLDLGFIAIASNVMAGFAVCIPLLHLVLHIIYG